MKKIHATQSQNQELGLKKPAQLCCKISCWSAFGLLVWVIAQINSAYLHGVQY